MPPEPLILGFDTSAAHCAAALLCGERIVAQMREEMTKGQAERLMPLLEEVLAAGNAGWSDLTALGVGTGPGNFTGVRIAVSAARGLALGLDIPAVGVSGLEAAAFGVDQPVLACLPAPRGQVYVQGFGTAPEVAELTTPEAVAGKAPCIGPAAGGVASSTGRDVLPTLPVAEAIARIASQQWPQTHLPPKPLYLKAPDAALPSEQPPLILDDA